MLSSNHSHPDGDAHKLAKVIVGSPIKRSCDKDNTTPGQINEVKSRLGSCFSSLSSGFMKTMSGTARPT
jgi:hypothetical protein